MTLNMEAGIVVIGAGGAGLAAAVTASEAGINDILVLEARGVPGGNSVFGEGFFAIDNRLKNSEDIEKLKDSLFKKSMDYTHNRIDPVLLRTLIDESDSTLRWLIDRGFRFSWKSFSHDTEVLLYATDVEAKAKTGAAIIRVLVEECRDRGVRVLCKTRVRKLVRDADGKIAGVRADSEGEKMEISSGCAIIASGGFSGNRRLLKKYIPSFTPEIHIAGIRNPGDGILMAAAVGADVSDTIAPEMEGPTFPWTRRLSGDFIGHPYSVWVNREGRRFTEEMFNPFQCANSLNRQPGKVSYTLMDEAIKNRIINESGPDDAWGARIDRLLRAHAGKGRVKIANSWDEVAEWAGISAEVLKNTIEEYNLSCRQGRDALFSKELSYLVPLLHTPYYAIHCRPSLLVTHGGIRISPKTEVLDTSGQVIPGLYAAGIDTGGIDAGTYNFHLPGHSFGFALSTGRMAGREAAAYLAGSNRGLSGGAKRPEK